VIAADRAAGCIRKYASQETVHRGRHAGRSSNRPKDEKYCIQIIAAEDRAAANGSKYAGKERKRFRIRENFVELYKGEKKGKKGLTKRLRYGMIYKSPRESGTAKHLESKAEAEKTRA
jgi:hypothetical protein